MRGALILAALVVLAACKDEISPAQQKAADDRDIAMVEATQRQHPPPVAIDLEGITEVDMAANRLYGASCEIIPLDSTTSEPILLLDGKRASLKLDGRVQALAGDPGSAKLPMDNASRFSGKRFVMTILKAPGAGERVGEDLTRWSATVTIRDPWDQLIYQRDAALECVS